MQNKTKETSVYIKNKNKITSKSTLITNLSWRWEEKYKCNSGASLVATFKIKKNKKKKGEEVIFVSASKQYLCEESSNSEYLLGGEGVCVCVLIDW